MPQPDLSGKSNWWDDSKSAVEIFDFERSRDLDDHPETMWRIKRAKNADDENESHLKDFPGVDLAHLAEESRDRSKRSSSRSFSGYSSNQTNVSANETLRRSQLTGNVPENAVGAQTPPSKHTAVMNEIPSASSREIDQRFELQVAPGNIKLVSMDHAESLDLAKNSASLNAFVNSDTNFTLFSTSDGTYDSRRVAGREIHEVAAEETPKGAGERLSLETLESEVGREVMRF